MATKVIFRKSEWIDDGTMEKWDEVVAVFPQEPATPDSAMMTCYAHMGQHGACTKDWYYKTKPAGPDEYMELWDELVRRGYDDLVIGHRITVTDDQKRAAKL